MARNVLVEPEVAETAIPKSEVEKLEQQLNSSSTVPSGGDPWEDAKWTKYKVSRASRLLSSFLV